MKQSVLLALLLTVSLVAAGCGGGGDGPDGDADGGAAAVDDADAAPVDEAGTADGAGRPGGAGTGESVVVNEVADFGVDVTPADPAAWTYLVYSMADTNLEAPMLADIAEAAAVGSSEDVNVVALVDREAGHTDEALLNLDDWESGKLLYVEPEALQEIADLGEIDMGDPNVLASFISFGMRSFPADRYALTVSDHGGGWTGMGPDDSSGEVMDLLEIESALSAGLADAGVERIDLLGFDACLMATYEVASTLAPHADYLLASEELEPGHGWDYTALGTAREDPTVDAATLGSAFVQGFAGQAAASGTGADITLSLIDLAAMDQLDQALAEFAGALGEQVDALGRVVGQGLAQNVSYGRSPDPSQSTHLTDLGALVAGIGIESLQVSDQADAVLRSINDAVVDQTVGPARLGSTGMSIYFPPTVDLTDAAYQRLPAAQSWAQFLVAYYTTSNTIPAGAQPAVVGQTQADEPAPPEDEVELGVATGGGDVVFADAEVVLVEDGVEVSVVLDPASLANVTEAQLSFGYIDPTDGAIVQLGDTTAEIFDDGTVAGFSDLTVLTLTDVDGDAIEAYLGLEFSEDGSLAYASVPLDYQASDSDGVEPVDLAIVLDAETGEVLQEVYYLIDEESGSYGELAADPDGLISPVVLVFEPDGGGEWLPFGDAAVFADLPNLEYGLVPLEPGTEVYVDITVTDFGGNQLIASGTFVLE